MCAIVFALVYAVAVLTETGQRLDRDLLISLQHVAVGPIQWAWPVLARRVLPMVLLVGVVVLGLIVVGRRPRRAVAAGVVVGASTVLSLWLKGSLPRPVQGWDEGYTGNTYPSTHVSATTALIVALWLMAPIRSPWLDRLLGGLVVFVALGNVVGQAHRPSDAIGSLLLVGCVTGSVAIAERVTASRRGRFGDKA
ncbi:hypothetical protein [Janibacter sp. GS2]|uniref:hypothetical protein n=1 Tax=Janibacter sp. GS2 TaxID=3442646 RepID=UPI003EC080DC